MVNGNTKIYYLHMGDNIPFYIGKTININNNARLNAHKDLLKVSILFLEEIDIVPTKEWKFWEKYYISLFKSWGFNLTNKNNGGGGCITHNVSESARKRIGNAHRGKSKSFSESHLKNLKQSLKGKKAPPSQGPNISKVLKGRKVTWDTSANPPKKAVLQYDLKWNFIKRWESITEANKALKCDVGGFLKNKQKTAGGSYWKYE